MKAGYVQLLWREVRQAAPAAAAFLLGIILWEAFLRSRVGVWGGPRSILPLALLPLGVLPLWALWRMVHGLRQDYATPHAHLLLSLPVPGWQLASAKLFVVWMELTLYALVIGAACVFLARGASFDELSGLPPALMHATERALSRSGLSTVLIGFFSIPVLLTLVQLAWVVGRLFPRGRGLITILAFLSGGWLLLRAAALAPTVLGWLPHVPLFILPDITVHGQGVSSAVLVAVALHPAPFLGVGVAALACFAVTAWLLEHQLEL